MSAPRTRVKTGGGMVAIEEFQKLELIVAQIKDVQDHPQADKLYVLRVDTGNGERQLVAGIRRSYAKETLLGKRIVMINNLQPAVIRGVESQGMLLAASDAEGVCLIAPHREV